MRNWVVALLFVVFQMQAQAETVKLSLYLNSGEMVTVNQDTFPYLAFNSSEQFKQVNERIHLTTADQLELTVYNTDSIAHGFHVKGQVIQHIISAGDSLEMSLAFPEEGCYIYEDHLNSRQNSHMGASGMIAVSDPNSAAARFYWNIKDHQSTFNQLLMMGGSVDWGSYYPDYFTINGKSHPDINSDPTARVVGAVGDTLHIFISNTGLSVHSLHFHGYHCKILYSSKEPHHKGRKKDTFGLYGGESIILELVPHQPGEFPVHDHNLVAVTGGGLYPNGIFTTLLIQ